MKEKNSANYLLGRINNDTNKQFWEAMTKYIGDNNE